MLATIKKTIIKPLLSRTLPNRLIVWKTRPVQDFIAITFDDGPNPKFTRTLLDILSAKNIKATFFLVGQAVKQYPDLAKQIVIDGHEIGNHTLTHNSFSRAKLENAYNEIRLAQDVIRETTGVRPTLFRPPYGILSLRIMSVCAFNGLTVVMWSLDTLDCEETADADAIRAVIRTHRIDKGEIVLMHDNNDHTLEILPEFITEQQTKGRHFVTISELLKGQSNSLVG